VSYYNELTFQLRLRIIEEDQIVAILKEIEEFSRESSESPEESFGTPEEYAERFPNQVPAGSLTKGGKGSRSALACIYLATALCVFNNWILGLFDKEFVDGMVCFLLSTGFGVAGIAAGITVDHRLPTGFTPSAEKAASIT
jgi:hypothetical protein